MNPTPVTVYLAAESKLTWYRSSGQWEQFQREVKKNGEAAVFEEASKLNGRIYTITLDADSYQSPSEEGKLVLQLLDDSAYDKSFLNGAVAIEIDMESGEVYSAFYGTRCKGLNYAEKDADGYLTMKEREYESRQKRLLGLLFRGGYRQCGSAGSGAPAYHHHQPLKQ